MPTGERTPVEILLAERAIYRTHFRFFRLSDTFDYARLGAECFTPDARIEYRIMPGPPQTFRSRDEFTDFMLAGTRTPGQAVAHVSGQATIDWVDGVPHLTAYATVWHWTAVTSPQGEHVPADWTTIGLIRDEYSDLDGRWLIHRRLVSPVAGLVAAGTAPGRGRPTRPTGPTGPTGPGGDDAPHLA